MRCNLCRRIFRNMSPNKYVPCSGNLISRCLAPLFSCHSMFFNQAQMTRESQFLSPPRSELIVLFVAGGCSLSACQYRCPEFTCTAESFVKQLEHRPWIFIRLSAPAHSINTAVSPRPDCLKSALIKRDPANATMANLMWQEGRRPWSILTS